MAHLEVTTQVDSGIALITPRGELDLAATPHLEDAIEAAARGPGVEGVVIDLSSLDFMDSSGLRTIVQADRQVRERGLRFALVRGGEPVHRVFEITRMTERLWWVEDPRDLLPDAEERA
jgi:anti-anti-sigma factor